MTVRREGAALVLAVVLSLAAVLLSHGALVLARAELTSAHASVRVLRVEHAARTAAIEAVERLSAAPATPLAGDSVIGAAGGIRWSSHFERISGEIWWVGGSARERATRRSGGFAMWRLDPRATVASTGAVLVTGGGAPVTRVDRIDATSVSTPPTPEPADGCLPDTAWSAALPAVAAWSVDPDSMPPRVGRLDALELDGRAELRVGGTGTPGPSRHLGTCTESPWNWGDPGGSDPACLHRKPLVLADSGTVVAGGRGQGVLVARGDLVLRDVAYFGLVLVDGTLRLEGTARLVGAVVARGGAQLSPEARITGSRCWLRAALAIPPLLAAMPAVPGPWIRLDG